MSDGTRSLRTHLRNAVPDADRFTGYRSGTEHPPLVLQLTLADYVSLLALFVAWVSVVLFLTGETNWAVVAMFGAYLFDKLDGWVARRRDTTSPMGRQIDSYIDVFTYLVPGALLYHYALAPNVAMSVVVGFFVLAFGGLRLVRHNDEGFLDAEGTSYYRGTTVVHTNLVVVANYLVAAFLPAWNGWFAAATILLAAPVMISEYRSPKTEGAHWLAGVIAVAVIGLCLVLEYGG